MLKSFFRFTEKSKVENQQIRTYFNECMDSINRSNLFMLRKVCMYTSLSLVFLPILASFIMEDYRITFAHLMIVALLCVYFFINLYIRKHEWDISTHVTGVTCGIFYFTLCFSFILMDTVAFPNSQCIWTPMIIVVFPMVYIDRMYKYGIEELIVITAFIILSYTQKSEIHFSRDMYTILAAYVLSMLSAQIVLEMRSREGLAMIELKKISSLDRLTHVLNKGALLQKIDDFYFKKDADVVCAMCVIDLDDFKQVNDNLGHSTGDLLLERVGQLLIDGFRSYDIIGRYGGDEFVVFMPNMTDITILQMRCRTLQMFLTDFSVGNGKPFSVSIGAIIDEGNHSSEDVFRMADDALYKSKIRGKNCCTTWVIEKNKYSNKPLLLLISNGKTDGAAELYRNENDRFEILSAFTADDGLRYISQYHSLIRLIVLETYLENRESEIVINYVKTREGFNRLPILAVADTEENSYMAKDLGADEVLMTDTPKEVYRDIIGNLIGM